MTDATALARTLGGEARGSRVYAPGPGHSPRDRSLPILIDPAAPESFVIYSYPGDDPTACRDYVRQRTGLGRLQAGNRAGRRAKQAHRAGTIPGDAVNRERAAAIWREARPPLGTLVEAYLRACGLELVHDVLAADAPRFHPNRPFRIYDPNERLIRLPTMIGATYVKELYALLNESDALTEQADPREQILVLPFHRAVELTAKAEQLWTEGPA